MMAKLMFKKSNQQICSQLLRADSFASRLIGLIGTKTFEDKAFYIPRCNWIHTMFMKIPIDVIYLDKNGYVKKIDHNLKPWKLASPVFSASSVIEVAAGIAKDKNIKIGDQLHVGD